MKKLQHLIFLLFFCNSIAFSQDPQFSQFANTSHLTNPALIGVYNGSMRFSIAYREQWGAVLGKVPFRTLAASADLKRPILKGDFVGAGVVVMRDEVNESDFRRDRAYAGAAYMKKLGGRGYRGSSQYLIAGGQFGLGQNSFVRPGLIFSDQFEDNSPVVATETQENFDNRVSPMFTDINAGLLWYGVFDDDRSIYIGGSIHHITKPNISFLGGGNRQLSPKYLVQIGGEFPISDNLTLLPAAVAIKQSVSARVIGGTNIRYNSREWREVALRLGIWGNVTNKLENAVLLDAAIISATLEMERMDFGLSYDLNTSGLSQFTNGRGAFEVTITYKQPSKERKLRVSCPRF